MRSQQFAQATGQRVLAADAAAFMQRVYGWMTAGLVVTGLTAWYIAGSPAAIRLIFGNPLGFLVVFLVQIGLVLAIRPVMRSQGAGAGSLLFLLYSASLGVTVSTLLLRFTGESVAQAFFVTAGAFGGLTLFAFATKRDLSAVGSFCMVGVIGLVIASVVNIFLQSPGVHFAISAIGVLIFAGLTAWDTQKMKDYAMSQDTDSETGRRAAVMAALELYLDFVLMFIYLTQLLGSSRD
ncbi:MAG: Bax inhibitor-1/YccA family protein [Candidatus Tectomicrobia bacterium]|uniref:Bax inhibitor-1/YccA family protein n=1 Tax=Tectimicrobiota bacterium TaxID=2528274 RepID=A0A932HVA8_UNCTE|nr:Bax inhibitor-1/YccA family protein [Candidatus Tectomicrobia bacterium]